jgi:hypothetical protein
LLLMAWYIELRRRQAICCAVQQEENGYIC